MIPPPDTPDDSHADDAEAEEAAAAVLLASIRRHTRVTLAALVATES